jgi:hypothetical protein
MSIGRNFEEALQKAVRMVNPSLDGFGPPRAYAADWAAAAKRYAGGGSASAASSSSSGTSSSGVGGGRPVSPFNASSTAAAADSAERESAAVVSAEDSRFFSELDTKLRVPSDTRLSDIGVAFDVGYSVDRVHALTKIDRWFLSKLKRVTDMAHELKAHFASGTGSVAALTPLALGRLKRAGFSDKQIGRYIGAPELDVRAARLAAGVVPYVKQIDTLAAEFPAATNYLYMTYNASEHDVTPEKDAVMVLGCGPYCIGSSVEFDWCAVSCVRALRASGTKAIVVNYNPETVSTDYDESDRLYFEELSLERVLDIYNREAAAGVVVSVGGQIPNNLAMPLHKSGVKILGTHPVGASRACGARGQTWQAAARPRRC